jgi:hypothetical protein
MLVQTFAEHVAAPGTLAICRIICGKSPTLAAADTTAEGR